MIDYVDWATATPAVFMAFGAGCVTTYTFMSKTMLANAKQAAENEKNLIREQFQIAMLKEEEKQELMEKQITELQARVNKLENLVMQHVPGYKPD